MKVLVIGHLCLDVIHPLKGPEIESYGGIYYAIGTLAALLGPGDSVIPVFGLNASDYEPLVGNLSRFPNVDCSGIFAFEEPTNRVQLHYTSASTRIECSRNIATPIPFDRIRKFLSVDGILVNMISGSDITLETFDQIRMAIRPARTPIHFDYHSLTLGVNGNNERFRRPLENWRRWGFMTDTIQMNEDEIRGLSGEAMSEEQTAGHLLTLSVRAVLITRGERGVAVYSNDRKRLTRTDIPGLAVNGGGEPTGCGDVFGAAFHYCFIKTSDLIASAEFANRTAAAKVLLRGSDHLESLRPRVVSD